MEPDLAGHTNNLVDPGWCSVDHANPKNDGSLVLYSCFLHLFTVVGSGYLVGLPNQEGPYDWASTPTTAAGAAVLDSPRQRATGAAGWVGSPF